MSLFRSHIDRLHAYVPGEQPQDGGWIKLNTNENPYPPSPRVIEAIQATAESRLHVYPDPLGKRFCAAVGDLFDIDPEWVLPANGSDENLTIIMRSFVDPGQLVAYPYPSYVLYETLAEIQAARVQRMPLNRDWSWDVDLARPVLAEAKVAFVPNPNSPSGNRWSDEVIRSLIPPQGVLVLDEAYGDFCDQPHCMELLKADITRRLIVTRTLSKSYSLAGLRCGFAVAHPDLIAGMRKVKDSYNVDALALAGGEAALRDQEWMQGNRRTVLDTRKRLSAELRALGYDVVESQANFVWATHPDGRHTDRFDELKRRKLLVRYMQFAADQGGDPVEGLRITIGTDEQISTLLAALREIG